MGISQKSLRHTHFRFFGISWNIGIFHFLYGTYKCPKIWDIRHSGIFQKNPGHTKTGKKWNIPDFLNIPEYSIFQIRDKGGGARKVKPGLLLTHFYERTKRTKICLHPCAPPSPRPNNKQKNKMILRGYSSVGTKPPPPPPS